MTGEQLITKGDNWQQVLNATGAIILQNQSATYSVQYHIGTATPTTETSMSIRAQNEHTPTINASELLYMRCLGGDAKIAWAQ